MLILVGEVDTQHLVGLEPLRYNIFKNCYGAIQFTLLPSSLLRNCYCLDAPVTERCLPENET